MATSFAGDGTRTAFAERSTLVEQGIDELFGVEELQVVDLFTDADVFDEFEPKTHSNSFRLSLIYLVNVTELFQL